MTTEFLDDQFELAYPDGVEDHWWQQARCAMIGRQLRSITRPGFLVVDVGCGRGIEVKYLRSQGFECIGIERAHVRPIAGVEPYVFAGTSADGLPGEMRMQCGTILLLDVLEHVDDAVTFLTALPASFPNASSLLLTAPARTELWSDYDEFYGHRRRFTLGAVQELACRTGLRLRKATYLFHALYPAAGMMTRLSRARPTRIEAPSGSMRMLHRMFARILVLDGLLFPAWLPGTSIMAWCEIVRH